MEAVKMAIGGGEYLVLNDESMWWLLKTEARFAEIRNFVEIKI